MAMRSIAAALFVKGIWASQPHADACAPGEMCEDAAALLQVHTVRSTSQLSTHVTWRVARDDWRGLNCDQVCEEYNMGCDDDAFAEVTSPSSMQEAVKMATGQGCPLGTALESEAASYGFAPYFDADVKFQCHYASATYHARCANLPLQWGKRVCPCTREAPSTQIKWRVARDEWRGQSCNQVCEGHGMSCEDDAFAVVTSQSGMEDAVKQATGQGCPRGVAYASEAASYGFAPYFDADERFACHYASTMYRPRCANLPLQWAKRVCPCTRYVTWRVARDEWRGQDCNQVCEAYGMGCDDHAFAEVTSPSSMEDAVKMATGQGCPDGAAYESEAASYGFAPYFDADVKFQCHYASSTYRARCANQPLQWGKRVCPCTRDGVRGPIR